MAMEICKKSVVKANVRTCIKGKAPLEFCEKVFLIFILFSCPWQRGVDIFILKCAFFIFDCYWK